MNLITNDGLLSCCCDVCICLLSLSTISPLATGLDKARRQTTVVGHTASLHSSQPLRPFQLEVEEVTSHQAQTDPVQRAGSELLASTEPPSLRVAPVSSDDLGLASASTFGDAFATSFDNPILSRLRADRMTSIARARSAAQSLMRNRYKPL